MKALITFEVDVDPAIDDISTVADVAENFEGILARTDGFEGARLVKVERLPKMCTCCYSAKERGASR